MGLIRLLIPDLGVRCIAQRTVALAHIENKHGLPTCVVLLRIGLFLKPGRAEVPPGIENGIRFYAMLSLCNS